MVYQSEAKVPIIDRLRFLIREGLQYQQQPSWRERDKYQVQATGLSIQELMFCFVPEEL